MTMRRYLIESAKIFLVFCGGLVLIAALAWPIAKVCVGGSGWWLLIDLPLLYGLILFIMITIDD